jgi:putative nucleotidyltransferase with HDIG domain
MRTENDPIQNATGAATGAATFAVAAVPPAPQSPASPAPPPAASPSSSTPQPAVAQAILENLASRMRQGGLCLATVRGDGSIEYADAAAGGFFSKFALPLARSRDPGNGNELPLAAHAKALTPASPVTIWRHIPGLLLAAFPLADKRHVQTTFVLIGKSHTFKLGEDVLRACGRIGVDGIWLAQQAEELPSYGEEALQRQARLLLSMMRDQIRLGGLEQELETLSTQLANTYEELSLIYQVSSGMKVNRSAGDFFKQACLDVMQVMDVRAMGVVLRGGDGSVNQPTALYGSLVMPQAAQDRLADALLAVFARRSGALLVNNFAKERSFTWMSEHARQLLAVPLIRQDQVLGCLFALDKNEDEFDSVDAKLLTSISNESAIYLENAMLYEDVHGLMMGLLHSLTSAVDAKDAYTCGHSERVALLSRHLAVQAGMTDAAADRVYMAGLLHDVGKIGVPEAVLQKTGKLTPEEFEQIKKHPEIGARILRDVKQIEDVIPGVLHHHERYDGKGYPSGLAAEGIPLMGRIICIADCFDAMTSSRTYRKALPLEVAMTEMRRCAGTQFDPNLADAFLRISTEELRDLLKNHAAVTKRMLEMPAALRAA